MPSTTARISSIGVSMLARSAASQASSPQSRKSPGGGPPALLTRMSASGHGGQHGGAALRRRDVGRDGGHRHAVPVADLRGRRLQRLAAAGIDDQRHAVLGQRHGAGTAQPLARRADDRPAPAQCPDPSALSSVSCSLRELVEHHAGPAAWSPGDARAARPGPAPAPPPARRRTSARSACTRKSTTSVSGRIWRSASCLTRRAASSPSSGAPMRTGHAVSRRERRSGSRRSATPATGRGGGQQQAAAAARPGGCRGGTAAPRAPTSSAHRRRRRPPTSASRRSGSAGSHSSLPRRNDRPCALAPRSWPDASCRCPAARSAGRPGPARRASAARRPAPPGWMAPAGSRPAPRRPACGRSSSSWHGAGRTPQRRCRSGREITGRAQRATRASDPDPRRRRGRRPRPRRRPRGWSVISSKAAPRLAGPAGSTAAPARRRPA